MGDVRLNKASAIKRFLARILNDLNNDRISESKAKALAYISQIQLKAIEQSDLETKITELEAEEEVDVVDFWGEGYKKEDYEFLQREYDNLLKTDGFMSRFDTHLLYYCKNSNITKIYIIDKFIL